MRQPLEHHVSLLMPQLLIPGKARCGTFRKIRRLQTSLSSEFGIASPYLWSMYRNPYLAYAAQSATILKVRERHGEVYKRLSHFSMSQDIKISSLAHHQCGPARRHRADGCKLRRWEFGRHRQNLIHKCSQVVVGDPSGECVTDGYWKIHGGKENVSVMMRCSVSTYVYIIPIAVDHKVHMDLADCTTSFRKQALSSHGRSH